MAERARGTDAAESDDEVRRDETSPSLAPRRQVSLSLFCLPLLPPCGVRPRRRPPTGTAAATERGGGFLVAGGFPAGGSGGGGFDESQVVWFVRFVSDGGSIVGAFLEGERERNDCDFGRDDSSGEFLLFFFFGLW